MKLRPVKKQKPPKSPTGDMALVEHLKELRTRVVISLTAIVCGTVFGFLWYQSAPQGMITLGEILRGPYCSLPPEYRVDLTQNGECRLLATSPGEMLLLRMKVGALAGLIVASPIWLYQVWAFITPGLHKHERRWTVTFVTLAVLLFVAGAVLAYFVFDIGLEFLLTVGDNIQTAALTGNDYFKWVLGFVVMFGAAFEVPLVISMLNILGILGYAQVKDKRRVIWVIIFIAAAFFTPGGEPFSMLILGCSVGILVELALQFCRINDKRRGVETDEFDELNDDEASDLDYRPAPIAPARPEPVAAPVDTRPSVAEPRPTQGSYFDDVL